jgi:uncharacterized Ntn-hydrolase superfamily protein
VTFSIVAIDREAGDAGVAVASKFLAVGAYVPWVAADAGAVANQSYTNLAFGPDGLALMRGGLAAPAALGRLVAGDRDARLRQVGIVDRQGGAASHTGEGCHGWAGHRIGEGFACQGNLLAGPQVVAAMAEAFAAARGSLAARLLAALAAGDAAGGDRRGRQSAALKVARAGAGYLGGNDVLVDLRVDDGPDPVAELGRLHGLQQLYFGRSPPAERLAMEGALLDELRAIAGRAGHEAGAAGAPWDDATRAALQAFIDAENLEERCDLGARTIDPPALAHLRRRGG